MMSYYDETAEKAIIGAAVSNPRITGSIKLTEPDFAQPIHGALWEAITKAHADGLKPDPTTITARLRPGINPAAIQALLVEVVGLGIVSNADAYAATIRDRAERRRIESTLAGIRQRLDNPDLSADDILAYAESHLLTTTGLDQAVETLWTLDEFLDRDLPAIQWLIPDLLATGERLVLTGTEGLGKSIAMRQIGACVAAGLHPFTLRTVPARKVLLVDCENPERIMMAKLGDLRRVIRARSADTATRFTLKRYPQGLNLADAKERLDLHHILTVTRPDLLLIGPAYKLYVGGSNSREEDLARLVTSHLDALREEFGFALILEHHSPHGGNDGQQRSVRPIGSSLWLRWPEFGLGLRPEKGTGINARLAELVPWRGARDERPWPRRLHGGKPGELPWIDPDSLRRAA